MLLKVGELARQSGLTIRALHHYDSIGLLTPSARSDAGYRLYNRADIARLHQIQALRGMGLSLAEIGALLARPDVALLTITEQQIRRLDRQITRQTNLRNRLVDLHHQLSEGEEPDLADWLKTLELMTMYEQHFAPEDLNDLPFYTPANQQAWRALVQEAHQLLQQGLPPESVQAQSLARRWMTLLERNTSTNPALAVRLNELFHQEAPLQEQTGVTTEMTRFILKAFTAGKLAIYERYLTPEEFAFMQANYGEQVPKWLPLLADLRRIMDNGLPPHSPEALQLAQRWTALFTAYAGTNPETHHKLRQAHACEPQLAEGTWMTDDIQRYLGQAMAALRT